jgi:molybdate transport system substrate-binding protein
MRRSERLPLENVMKRLISAAMVIAASLVCGSMHADAADIKLLASAAIRPAMDMLAPQFEQTTKNKVVARYVLTPEVPKLIEGGEAFDVAIANPPHIESLIKSGKVVAGSRAQVARFGLGVGVRKGAARPDVATVEGFRQTLLKARSIAYVGAGTSGPFFVSVTEKLGIGKDVKDKLRPGSIAENLGAVAKGQTEIVVMPVPLILTAAGVDLAGAVPVEYQDHIVLVAGLATNAPEAKAGQALIQYLVSADAEAALKKTGYERIQK